MTFKELGLDKSLLNAISESGYSNPTPIQEKSIPHILNNEDVLGSAQTGTGKTAAFAIPTLQLLLNKGNSDAIKKIKVLVITPTRELAIQIRDNYNKYGKYTNLKTSVVLGGVNQKSQVNVLRQGVDILVATPGRLLDLIKQKHININFVETVILDESDTMLDMGFIGDVKKILAKLPEKHQTLLFSATMPPQINKLALELLKNHVTIKIDSISSAAPNIDQTVYFVDKPNKVDLLLDIFKKQEIKSLLIFTRTKIGADKLSVALNKYKISNEVIHGNKAQRARVSALKRFKDGKSNILIATDVAAHGIDIKGLSHVINYDLPDQAEVYVHRIGRTGRAGATGKAISFCDKTQKNNLRSIQALIKDNIKVVEDHDYHINISDQSNSKRSSRDNRSFKKAKSSSSNRSFRNNENVNDDQNNKNRSSHFGNSFKRNNDDKKTGNKQNKNYGESREKRNNFDSRSKNTKKYSHKDNKNY